MYCYKYQLRQEFGHGIGGISPSPYYTTFNKTQGDPRPGITELKNIFSIQGNLVNRPFGENLEDIRASHLG